MDKFLQEKSGSFEHGTIYRVSVAAAPLAVWVKANVAFSKVLEKVHPLEEALEHLTRSLETSQSRLKQCTQDLAELDDEARRQITSLRAQLTACVGKH